MNILSFRLHSGAMYMFALCADARRSHFFYIRRDMLNNNNNNGKEFYLFFMSIGHVSIYCVCRTRGTEQVGQGQSIWKC